VITPYHYNIPRTTAIANQTRVLGKIGVSYEGVLIPVNVLGYKDGMDWCFLQAEDERFFAGIHHPYDVGTTQQENLANLRRDALFFGLAVARALPVINSQLPWILLMQDWEAATVALALATDLKSTAADRILGYLTLHNSYDCGVSDVDLLQFRINPLTCPGRTVLQRALPLVEAPIFTVSDQFALDFTDEIFQAEVMAPHLQSILPHRLVGVPNGLFVDLSIDADVYRNARSGNYRSLLDWKAENRNQMLVALEQLKPVNDQPIWGNLAEFNREDAPWFVMAGRDDPRQKGYDVACRAIDDLVTQEMNARFLFFPIPGDEGLEGLVFLKDLAERYPKDVLVFPFLFREGFSAALRGAAYGIMPSLYEPFGMANEFYLNGTVGIGRATGGIIQQIVPLKAARAYSHAVQIRTHRYYGASERPTGILYRERDDIPSASNDWKSFNETIYYKDGIGPDRIQQRQGFLLFKAMCVELKIAMMDGLELYQENPELYCRMLVAGIDYIQDTFSWKRAAQAYARHFDG
jgi:glycogen synthase